MIHFIYKTLHTDGRYYIGRHSTTNINDGYIGSGSWIQEIKKDKDQIHLLERTILKFVDSEKSLLESEEELITIHFGDPLCMNKTKASSGFKNEDWLDPISREKRISSMKQSLSSPEAKERKRKASEQNWKNPEYVSNHKKAMKCSCNTTEAKENYSNASLQRWADNEFKSKMKEAQSIGNNKPEVIARKKEISKARWKDKQFVEKMNMTCEYCGKNMLKGLYTRWHGSKCKENNNNE